MRSSVPLFGGDHPFYGVSIHADVKLRLRVQITDRREPSAGKFDLK